MREVNKRLLEFRGKDQVTTPALDSLEYVGKAVGQHPRDMLERVATIGRRLQQATKGRGKTQIVLGLSCATHRLQPSVKAEQTREGSAVSALEDFEPVDSLAGL
jgi:hypothetical protein